MDRLRLISSFIQVARAGNFSKAAAGLGVSPQAVSGQISQLERWLGVRLFNRTTRQMGLTEEGRMFFERCEGGMGLIDQGEAELRGRVEDAVGTVRLAVGFSFAQTLVTPLLARFMDKYPRIDIELLTINPVPDVVELGVDVGLIGGGLPDSSLIAKRIGAFGHVLCASPGYLERHGMPASMDDLIHHRCVSLRNPRTGQIWPWTFESEGNIVTPDLARMITIGDVETQRWMVLNDGGIGQVANFFAAPHMAAGRLVPVDIGYRPAPVELHVYMPKRTYVPFKSRALFDFLFTALHANPDLRADQGAPRRKPRAAKRAR